MIWSYEKRVEMMRVSQLEGVQEHMLCLHCGSSWQGRAPPGC